MVDINQFKCPFQFVINFQFCDEEWKAKKMFFFSHLIYLQRSFMQYTRRHILWTMKEEEEKEKNHFL